MLPRLLLIPVVASFALFAAPAHAGRASACKAPPFAVLPLSGVTHMTPQEVVAENLKLLQVAFLKNALDV